MNASNSAGPSRRIKNLDVLRGVAILLVLGEHKYASDIWLRIGWTGVDLFFVLSGFLISGLLFSEFKTHGTIRVRRFLIRRGFKIYPGYYILMLYYIVRDLRGGIRPSTQTLLSLVFLQNYGPGPVNYTWSLAVEEHFYLVLPLVLSVMIALASRAKSIGLVLSASDDRPPHALSSLPKVIAFGCGLVLASRCLTTLLVPYDNRTHHFPTHLRIDSLMFGVVIGYFYNFHYDSLRMVVQRRRNGIFIAGCVLLSSCVWLERTSPAMFTIGLTALYAGYGCILALALLALPTASDASPPRAPIKLIAK